MSLVLRVENYITELSLVQGYLVRTELTHNDLKTSFLVIDLRQAAIPFFNICKHTHIQTSFSFSINKKIDIVSHTFIIIIIFHFLNLRLVRLQLYANTKRFIKKWKAFNQFFFYLSNVFLKKKEKKKKGEK